MSFLDWFRPARKTVPTAPQISPEDALIAKYHGYSAGQWARMNSSIRAVLRDSFYTNGGL